MKRKSSEGVRHQHSRNRLYRIHKRAKRRENVGILTPKQTLDVALLNVDGYSDVQYETVKDTIKIKNPDICILLETKRRQEVISSKVEIDRYDIIERRRSNTSGDRAGGGILVYLRNDKGYRFEEHVPSIENPQYAFVAKERIWIKVESAKCKTAVCGLYCGFQASDDRHGLWNEALYDVLRKEVHDLCNDGYRVLMLGDFNAHVGNSCGVGVVGNHPNINLNGDRFMNFLRETNSLHLNGACRVQGDWSTRISEGLLTWQQNGISTIIDYGVVSNFDLNSIKEFVVDDRGQFPSGSDHNWIFCSVEDKFNVKVSIPSQKPLSKPHWNFNDAYNWAPFANSVQTLIDSDPGLQFLTANELASKLSDLLTAAAKISVGFKPQPGQRRLMSTSLPKDMVSALNLKRELEAKWKSLLTNLDKSLRTTDMIAEVTLAENEHLAQKSVVNNLFAQRRSRNRSKILRKCQGHSITARRNFWSHVSSKEKASSEITCVNAGGILVQDFKGITVEVEDHLKRVFLGSSEPTGCDEQDCVQLDHSYSQAGVPIDNSLDDHSYSKLPTPKLPSGDGSGSIYTDPTGWLDRPFSIGEVCKAIKNLKNNKAMGFDSLPNEFIKYSGSGFHNLLHILFNKILESGVFPTNWNKGRVSLIHKRGSREILGNYRPITVIPSMSGLYSRVLNERLTDVVENHKLLGEIQNGFRRGRSGSDNAFILDTILWKSKAQKAKVYMAFFDIQKAYDSVNRNILWKKLSSLGFGGKYLQTLKSIYAGDSIQCDVNGLRTRPIYLRRGLRQGCSLSPLLFNLYISSLGNDLSISTEGFRIGKAIVSALLFADDLVVIARSRSGLLKLMAIVKKHSDSLKLELNTDPNKSEVVAQEGSEGDSWDLVDTDGSVSLSLKQVMQYKYLGSHVFPSMSKTAKEKVKQCVVKARKYKGSCICISQDGPDRVDMILATWSNIALPSILFGCEMIPFCDTAIKDIERIQSQIAKYALGLPISAPNICAQVDLGLKPFRHILYELQLKYYNRVRSLSDERWVKQALLDHLSLAWESPYLEHIFKIRNDIGLISVPFDSRLSSSLNNWSLSNVNSDLQQLALPWIRTTKTFKRSRFVEEGLFSDYISMFKYNSVAIGTRFPRPGMISKQLVCPLCPTREENSVMHLALFCQTLEHLRRTRTGITSFRNMCQAKEFSNMKIFELFINGEDWNEIPISTELFRERGTELFILWNEFNSRW